MDKMLADLFASWWASGDPDAARAVWLADLDPARVAELADPGPLPAAGRLQSFSVSVRRIAFLTAVV